MRHHPPDADELQTLANVLDDGAVPRPTRRRLLQGAAAGAVSVSALAAPRALAGGRRDGESPGDILSALATAESFGVTFLTEAVRRAPGTPSAALRDTLRAANTAEYDHVLVLEELGGVRFTGVTAFAHRGSETAARWLAEGCAIESEHRAIARFAQTALGGRQQISIDRSFAPWGIRTAAAMIAALESAGIGFGRQGAAPGAFYEFPGDPVRTGARLVNNGRRPDEPSS
jgi:hypothetical protein